MADAAAKAHLQAGDDGEVEPVTEVVRAHVRGRPCVYEVRVGEGEDARWELMDRPAFKASRLCARGYVRRRLGETVREGACVAGLQEPLWPEVAAGMGKLPPGYTPYNEDAGAATAYAVEDDMTAARKTREDAKSAAEQAFASAAFGCFPPGSTSSTARIAPTPRTSPMTGCSF